MTVLLGMTMSEKLNLQCQRVRYGSAFDLLSIQGLSILRAGIHSYARTSGMEEMDARIHGGADKSTIDTSGKKDARLVVAAMTEVERN